MNRKLRRALIITLIVVAVLVSLHFLVNSLPALDDLNPHK